MTEHPFSRDSFKAEAGQVFIANGRTYHLAGIIGNGAIGVVRKAVDPATGVLYAVKFLAPEFKYIEASSIEDIKERFIREGRQGAELDHDCLVKIHAYEENKDGANFETKTPVNPFILMEYIQGKTLESYIKHLIPSPALDLSPQKLYIAYKITEAVKHLHDRSIIHRDIKPANIFPSKNLDVNGNPLYIKLGDFGVVKWGDFKAAISTGTLTLSGQQGLGTLKYMPHEQGINPKDVTVRSDMYSLGVTLFELFSNQILPNFFLVQQIREVRLEKGNLDSRLRSLGLVSTILPPHIEQYRHILEAVLDCFLKPSGRPSSRPLLGMLKAAYISASGGRFIE